MNDYEHLTRAELIALIHELRANPDRGLNTAAGDATEFPVFGERERAEEELKRQKKLLEVVFDNLPLAVFIKDAQTLGLLMSNRFARKRIGLPVDNFAGKTVYDLFPKDQADQFNKSDREALETERMVDIPEQEVLGRSGEMRIQHVRKVPVFDEMGEPWVLVGIADDITERKRAEERTKQLISMSPAAIFTFSADPPFATTYISDNVTVQVGWQPSDFTSDPSFWHDRIHPDDRAAVLEALARITTEGKYAREYRFRHKDGSWRWMHDEGQVVRDAGGTVREGIGIWMEITAQREEAEERLQRALRQRDALVKEVHHRIKNHLQGIAGLLRQEARAYPGVASLIDRVVAQMKSVALVYGLQNGVDTGVPLGQVLAAICASVEGLMACRIIRKWDARNAGPLRLAAAEAVPIAVALNELVYNAVKHCERSAGVATIEVDYAERGPKAEIRIANRGALPQGFNYATGAGCGTGLDLVKTLLGPKGSMLGIWMREGVVETALTLEGPLVALRPLQTAA